MLNISFHKRFKSSIGCLIKALAPFSKSSFSVLKPHSAPTAYIPAAFAVTISTPESPKYKKLAGEIFKSSEISIAATGLGFVGTPSRSPNTTSNFQGEKYFDMIFFCKHICFI